MVEKGQKQVFQPKVKVVMDVPKPTVKDEESTTDNGPAVAAFAAAKTDKAKFIIIAAIVVFFVLLAIAALRVAIGKAKMSLVGEALKRHEAIKNIGTETDTYHNELKPDQADKKNVQDL